ncbi:coiled-coil domain-containing protein 84 [Aplysia californica]|uniref:Coiled-coil domain-containing protein 84 n=1 Tax=Aplysia californica TaxID=6500 RepID=A0ABM1A4M9_APLCA|nr:coiled-coil domain-containing protein 84 [Aplysia californica]
MSSVGSFTQFLYCPLCRISYKKSRKHMYSKRHQEIVLNILKKFSTKIQNAKASVTQPKIRMLTAEDREIFFWCYFCQKDVLVHSFKQSQRGDCVIESGGILEHISGSDHGVCADRFLKENKVELERKQEFVMSSQGYMKFWEAASYACESFVSEKVKALQQITADISGQNLHSQYTLMSATLDKNDGRQSTQGSFVQPGPQQQTRDEATWFDPEAQRKKTERAFGEGLTALDRTQEDDSVGNIYTNALPPWLRADPDADGAATASRKIGPDIGDWDKHKKLKKKSLLRADRTGAKFDRQKEQSDNWLPSFGGVWRHSARTHSVKHFQKRQDLKDPSRPSASSGSLVVRSGLSKSSNSTPTGNPWLIPNCLPTAPSSGSQTESRVNGAVPSSFVSDSGGDGARSVNVRPYVRKQGGCVGSGRSMSDFHASPAEPTGNLASSEESFMDFVGVKPYVRKRRSQNKAAGSVAMNSYPYPTVYGGGEQDRWRRQVSGDHYRPSSSRQQADSTYSKGDREDSSFSLISTPVLHLK